MSNTLVALFFAAGVAGWVYYQVNRRMSGNPVAVWTATALAGLVAGFVFYTLFAWVFTSGS